LCHVDSDAELHVFAVKELEDLSGQYLQETDLRGCSTHSLHDGVAMVIALAFFRKIVII
jgi:hypothetical protein